MQKVEGSLRELDPKLLIRAETHLRAEKRAELDLFPDLVPQEETYY